MSAMLEETVEDKSKKVLERNGYQFDATLEKQNRAGSGSRLGAKPGNKWDAIIKELDDDEEAMVNETPQDPREVLQIIQEMFKPDDDTLPVASSEKTNNHGESTNLSSVSCSTPAQDQNI